MREGDLKRKTKLIGKDQYLVPGQDLMQNQESLTQAMLQLTYST